MSQPLAKIRATSLPRRGLSREEAAMYLGVGAGTFDLLRKDGVIDLPRIIGGRMLFDIRDLDAAFDALPRDEIAVKPGEGWEDV